MKRVLKNRWFQYGFAVTLTLIFLVTALVVVDYRGRSITFDDNTPVAQIEEQGEKTYLDVFVFGIDKSFDISVAADAAQAFADFICFPQS